jgi:hypothetical protein
MRTKIVLGQSWGNLFEETGRQCSECVRQVGVGCLRPPSLGVPPQHGRNIVTNARRNVTVMSGVNEFERCLIRARCEEGIERAKAKGTKFGRKVKLTPEQRRVAAARYAKGETQAELAKVYEVSEAAMCRAVA